MGAALVGMEVIRCRRVERGKVRRLGTQQGTQMKMKEPGRPGKESSVLSFLMLLLVPLQTETLLLQAERRALCACWPAGR